MAHFAKVENGIVTQVLVIEQDEIDTGNWGDPGSWVQTSYNTRGGVHYGPDGKPDGGVALRKNYAGIGDTYDATLDAFYMPQPYPSWSLNFDTCLWEAPVPKPEPVPGSDYRWIWDEATQSWVIQN